MTCGGFQEALVYLQCNDSPVLGKIKKKKKDRERFLFKVSRTMGKVESNQGKPNSGGILEGSSNSSLGHKGDFDKLGNLLPS